MEFSLANLQPKERASFALRALYEAAGCRKYHMGRFEEYGLYQENRSFLSSEQVITFTDLDGRPQRDPALLLSRERLPPFRREPHL